MNLTVPPLPEQHEIVRRVEALFTLADQLEARYTKAKVHVDRLTQSILTKAFRGELVPQDENDEPAALLLERIRTDREGKSPLTRRSAAPSPRGRGASKAGPPSPLPLAAEAPAAYTAGGQAALPAANQPVPARILAAMSLGRDYSRAELLAATGISEADWSGAIRQLKEQKKVMLAGEKRGARYRRAT